LDTNPAAGDGELGEGTHLLFELPVDAGELSSSS
jgi:hypothetical protein